MCNDPFAEICGQSAWGGEAVRSEAALIARSKDRFSRLCVLMYSILPCAIQRDLAGVTFQKMLFCGSGRSEHSKSKTCLKTLSGSVELDNLS